MIFTNFDKRHNFPFNSFIIFIKIYINNCDHVSFPCTTRQSKKLIHFFKLSKFNKILNKKFKLKYNYINRKIFLPLYNFFTIYFFEEMELT